VADKKQKPLTYKDAGVDIAAGDALVDAIKPLAKSTVRPGADSELGGFGGLFDLKAAGFKDPILVAATDGVGSKVKIALKTGIFNTVGIDLVAMCVNDLIVQGAEPLFFLDYYATGKLDIDSGKQIVAGIADGCKQANCALIGGETAEMPGLYHDGDFDLAGFSVGAAERDGLLDPDSVEAGDILIGLPSSGIHSNGISLVRKLIEQNSLSYSYKDVFPGQKGTLGEDILTPTIIYVRPLMPLIKNGDIKALAHITGGGLIENVPRSLPKGVDAYIDADTWAPQPIFAWLQEISALPPEEMLKTFNCGIGMVVITSPENKEKVLEIDGAVEIGAVHKSGNATPSCYVCSQKGALGKKGSWQTKPAGDTA